MTTPNQTTPTKVEVVGEAIRQIRIARKMTLPELAIKAKVSKGALSKIENGGDLCLSTLIKVCRALGVAPAGVVRYL